MVYKTIFILIVIFAGLSCKQVNETKHIEPICINTQSPCQVTIEEGDFSLTFNVENVVSETEFALFLTYQGQNDSELDAPEITDVTAYLEGKEMFMGKVPIIFNVIENNKYKAEAILGSCAEQKMMWRLWININFIDQRNKPYSKSIFYDFESVRI